MKTALFLCTHNSARSQMAEAFLNKLCGDRYEAKSAGITPTQINPYVVKAMAEIGLDLSTHRSKSILEFQGKTFDYVVTVCDAAREACPFFPGEKEISKSFPDPSEFKGTEAEIIGESQRVKGRNTRLGRTNLLQRSLTATNQMLLFLFADEFDAVRLSQVFIAGHNLSLVGFRRCYYYGVCHCEV